MFPLPSKTVCGFHRGIIIPFRLTNSIFIITLIVIKVFHSSRLTDIWVQFPVEKQDKFSKRVRWVILLCTARSGWRFTSGRLLLVTRGDSSISRFTRCVRAARLEALHHGLQSHSWSDFARPAMTVITLRFTTLARKTIPLVIYWPVEAVRNVILDFILYYIDPKRLINGIC